MVAGYKQTLSTACCHRHFKIEAIWRKRAVILKQTLTYYIAAEYWPTYGCRI